MNTLFIDRLIGKINKSASRVCVGLDPRFENLPRHLREKAINRYGGSPRAAASAFTVFNKKIIDAVFDCVCAIKIQIAFYEQYGTWGIKSFAETAEYAKSKDMIVIGDVKRNDIGSTAQAYSRAYLSKPPSGSLFFSYDLDCITVNPYLGFDGIEPFIQDVQQYNKGIFVLVRTSNSSAGEIQDLKVGKKKVYEIIAELVARWGAGAEGKFGYNSVGAVVGATYPNEAKKIRKIMPKTFFLVPGYGAQGAKAADVANCFNTDGLGAIINSSRDIIFAYQKDPWASLYGEHDFATAARDAALSMNSEINQVIPNP